MAGVKPFKDGPSYVADAAADLYVAPTGQSALVRHIRLVNKSAGAIVCTVYLGSTGGSTGGTELFDESIPADSARDVYFPSGLEITTATYISAVAGTASTIVATITGELYAA